MNPDETQSKKPIVAKLIESFYKNGEEYTGYDFGMIKYDNGAYSFLPTEDDEAYTKAEKQKILEDTIEEDIPVYNDEDEDTKNITKDDPNYLFYYASQRTNIYGGLFIMKKEAPVVTTTKSDATSTETDEPVDDDTQEEVTPDTTTPVEKPMVVTKKKKLQ